ncbi:hypothetical protein [Halalkalirubrum salinum]|uniref:hypothetical protein n=1 Tax=Halalkalirubrum salinum TaxID=2563889 RepID=UPI0010FB54EF|nr:hypothetical protein [Halalkalirubrum salinum]
MTTLSLEALTMLGFTLVAFYGVAGWALIRTLRQEGQKVELIEGQGRVDTYSPKGLAALGKWIDAHPDDPYAEEAREQYNECVEALQTIDQPFYDWSDTEIKSLDRK